MEDYRIAIFNKIITENNQFKDNSNLWKVIKEVWNVSDKDAKELAKEYCNVISFYAVSYANELIDCSLADFMYKLKDKKLFRKDGYLKDKSKILKCFNVNFKKKYVETMDTNNLDNNKFYQMRIKTGFNSYHFIGCYIENKRLYLSDSSNRGIMVLVEDAISIKQFNWMLIV